MLGDRMTDILVIDNIDSFVYNLVQYLGELGATIQVATNDITMEKVREINPDKIVISPGPGRPESAGNSLEVIRTFKEHIPILGVCLGHQCIGQVFGATIGYAQELIHGKIGSIKHDGKTIFKGITNPLKATRYHSLIIEQEGLPSELEVSAFSSDGHQEIMAIRHKKYPLEGVQFHPESILTKGGKRLLRNFLERE